MSASGSAVSLPSGYSPPFTVVTDSDHSGWIIIATALGLACILLFAIARLITRYATASSFGQDDYVFLMSVVITIVQSCVLLYGCSLGLGASMAHMALPIQVKVQKIYYASNLLWVIALSLSKISVLFLLRRIDELGRRKFVFDSVAVFIGAWTVASLFALAMQCNLSHPWITLHEHCTSSFLRWGVISTFDILTEFLLLALAVFILWNLQTSRSRKATIVASFACRLLLIVAIGFRLATFDRAGLASDPSLEEAQFVVWSQAELNYSIISATIPSLLQFMKNLNTVFGGLSDQERLTYGSHGRSNGLFPLSYLRRGKNTKASNTASQTWEEVYLNKSVTKAAAKTSSEASKQSVGSSNSQKMIIRKDVSYEVEYH